MYVEISPRRSGKTTRLIESAVDCLKNNAYNIGIVSYTIEGAKSIKDKIINELLSGLGDDHVHILVNEDYNKRILIGNTTRMVTPTGCRPPEFWFFDEFCYIDNSNLIHPIDYSIITDAYYTSTPPYAVIENDIRGNIVVDYCLSNGIDINVTNPIQESILYEMYGDRVYDVLDIILPNWLSFKNTYDSIRKKDALVKEFNFIHKLK